METRDVYRDAYDRIRDLVHRTADGLADEAVLYRPDPDANSIGWLLWHMTRVQDDHVSEIAGRSQVWEEGPWAERFGLAPGTMETGYGHTSEQVASVRPDSIEAMVAYHDAVADRTSAYLDTIDSAELDRIIDFSWDPPVSVGVRLVSVIGDSYQHAGQARYVRGMIERMT